MGRAIYDIILPGRAYRAAMESEGYLPNKHRASLRTIRIGSVVLLIFCTIVATLSFEAALTGRQQTPPGSNPIYNSRSE